MIEEVVTFGTPELAGILCRPASGARADLPGVVMLTPGQLHRVGPNRFYVKIARALAAEGFSVLRFDFSSRGDSPPRTDMLPLLQSSIAETQAAMDLLISQTGCSKVLLIGHCSGAAFSLSTAFEDERVAGVVAIGPEGGEAGWVEYDRRLKEARFYANYYSRGAVSDSGRWRRLLTGKADYKSIVSNLLRGIIWYRVSTATYRLRLKSGIVAKEVGERSEVVDFKASMRDIIARRMPILVIHPDQSGGRERLRAILGDTIDELRAAGHFEIAMIRDADHTFTPLAAQHDLIETICQWIHDSGFVPPVPVAAPAAIAG